MLTRFLDLDLINTSVWVSHASSWNRWEARAWPNRHHPASEYVRGSSQMPSLLPPCSSPWGLRSTEQLVIHEASTAPTSAAALPHFTAAKAVSLQWFRGAPHPRPNLAFAPAYSSDPISGSLLLQFAGLSHPGQPAVSQSFQEHLCLLPRPLLLDESEPSPRPPSAFTWTPPSRCLLSSHPPPSQSAQHRFPAPHPSCPALFFTFSISKTPRIWLVCCLPPQPNVNFMRLEVMVSLDHSCVWHLEKCSAMVSSQ